MQNITSALLVCFFMLVLLLNGLSDAVYCSQCNMRQRGISNTCLDPRNMTKCIGCMKTITKIKLRDSGRMDSWERMSVVVSRYCMRQGSTKIKPEGCYKQQNNGGYTERCYCYTDNCNSGASSLTYGYSLSSLLSLPSSFTFVLAVVVAVLVFTTNTGWPAASIDI